MKCQFLIRQNLIDNKMNLIVSDYNLFYIRLSYPFISKYVSEYNLNWVSQNQLVVLINPKSINGRIPTYRSTKERSIMKFQIVYFPSDILIVPE